MSKVLVTMWTGNIIEAELPEKYLATRGDHLHDFFSRLI